jgi:hypothetical protein
VLEIVSEHSELASGDPKLMAESVAHAREAGATRWEVIGGRMLGDTLHHAGDTAGAIAAYTSSLGRALKLLDKSISTKQLVEKLRKTPKQ